MCQFCSWSFWEISWVEIQHTLYPFWLWQNSSSKWSKGHHPSSAHRATDVRMLFMTTWWREPPTTVEFFQSPWSTGTQEARSHSCEIVKLKIPSPSKKWWNQLQLPSTQQCVFVLFDLIFILQGLASINKVQYSSGSQQMKAQHNQNCSWGELPALLNLTGMVETDDWLLWPRVIQTHPYLSWDTDTSNWRRFLQGLRILIRFQADKTLDT